VHFDLSREATRLQNDFETLIASFPGPLQLASVTLLQRCNIGASQELNWNARFRPLTLLYPLLETEGFPGFDPEMGRRLTLAHECLIVYGFLDDRLRDGQMRFHETEIEFMQRLALEAVVRLLPEGAEGVPPELDAAVKSTMETYRESQTVKYAPVGEPFEVNSEQVRHILGSRALYGYISTLALIRLAGASDEQARQLRSAFDWVATGLQWVDDTQDLGEDLTLGEENLLLRLAIEEGTNAYEDAANGASLPAIFGKLVASGALTAGARHAKACFETAAAIQLGLGNRQLHGMLIERTELMDRLIATAEKMGKAGGSAG
jgi:hypothetical protein